MTNLVSMDLSEIVLSRLHVTAIGMYDKSHRTTKPTIRRATSEDSDQPAHLRSLIIVIADRMCLLKPPGYPKRDTQEPLPYWVDVQADLCLYWSHRSYCILRFWYVNFNGAHFPRLLYLSVLHKIASLHKVSLSRGTPLLETALH